MILYLLFWDGILPPNNYHAIGSRRPAQKKKKKINETRCYFNSTIQVLYFIILFRIFILNIDCNKTMNGLDSNGEKFDSHYQNILILKYLQKHFCEVHFGWGNNIVTDDLSTVTNIRIYRNINAA